MNRRFPERVKLRPEDAAGVREAWDVDEEWHHNWYANRDLDRLLA